MKKYRITISKQTFITLNKFHNQKVYDIEAESVNEAFHKAYELAGNSKDCSISVMEIPKGPSPIGLLIEYEDTFFRRFFTDCIIIRANSEEEAVAYYNKYLKGGRFWFSPGKTEADGRCIRGRVQETYYAASKYWEADATLLQTEETNVQEGK